MTLPQAPPSSPAVYLIDDDPNDVLILRRLCESVGIAVYSYSSPRSFLAELNPQRQGCIVADLLMPEMTGLQLHAELKKAGSELPIIVVTGHADAMTCRVAFQNGVYDFVEKSLNSHDLLVVIRQAIQHHASQNRERQIRESFSEHLNALSPRESEVMHLLADGWTLKEIAAEFDVSVQTASKHRGSLFEKLAVGNEIELLKLLIAIDPNHAKHTPVSAA